MIHSASFWSIRPRLTMSTMMVLVAVAAPCFALAGFPAGNSHRQENAASPLSVLVAAGRRGLGLRGIAGRALGRSRPADPAQGTLGPVRGRQRLSIDCYRVLDQRRYSPPHRDFVRRRRPVLGMPLFLEHTIMIHSASFWSIRPRLTMSTMMCPSRSLSFASPLRRLQLAIPAPVRNAASLSSGAGRRLRLSLAAASPGSAWVGAVQRIPPRGLLVRFAVGNGFLSIVIASLISAGIPLLIAILFAAGVLFPSLAWYSMSLMEPGPDRDRIKRAFVIFLSYVCQLAVTLVLFVAATAVLLRLS